MASTVLREQKPHHHLLHSAPSPHCSISVLGYYSAPSHCCCFALSFCSILVHLHDLGKPHWGPVVSAAVLINSEFPIERLHFFISSHKPQNPFSETCFAYSKLSYTQLGGMDRAFMSCHSCSLPLQVPNWVSSSCLFTALQVLLSTNKIRVFGSWASTTFFQQLKLLESWPLNPPTPVLPPPTPQSCCPSLLPSCDSNPSHLEAINYGGQGHKPMTMGHTSWVKRLQNNECAKEKGSWWVALRIPLLSKDVWERIVPWSLAKTLCHWPPCLYSGIPTLLVWYPQAYKSHPAPSPLPHIDTRIPVNLFFSRCYPSSSSCLL